MHSPRRGFEGRSHDGQNIGRFYPRSLGDYFSGDSGLVYDSRIQPETPPGPVVPSSLRREAPVLAGPKPYAAGNVKLVPREASRCPMHCLVTTPS